MEILTGGSFVNLDNREKINALVYTARVMAETAVETEGFVNEAESSRQVADDIWHGAEYMCREHEAQQIKNVFVNNFLDRLKELKPDESAIQPATTTEEIAAVENDDYRLEEAAAQNETDEFLGFVAANAAKPEVQTTGEVETEANGEQVLAESDAKTVASIAADAVTNSESSSKPAQSTPTHETDASKLQFDEPNGIVAVEQTDCSINKATAENEQSQIEQISEAALPAAPVVQVETVKLPEKEPYQFDKCTVTTTIQFLPVEADNQRRAVVSVRTHEFAPQIWTGKFPGEAGLDALLPFVNQALQHYQQELPAKVMDKMRKEKSSGKKSIAATPKSVNTNQSNASTKTQLSPAANVSTAPKTEPKPQSQQTQNEVSTPQTNIGNSNALSNAASVSKAASKSVQKTDTAQGSLF